VQPVLVDGVADAVAIAAGASQSGIVRKDGSVWVWGDNGNSGLGLDRPATGAVPEIRVPTKIAGVANAVDLSLAAGSSIVASDGSLRTWGDARLGATGRTGIERVMKPTVVPNVNSLMRVWGSAYSNLALARDGHLVAWGAVFLAP
jgi:alpha-tubulin suppressor-like RCC1 family protein